MIIKDITKFCQQMELARQNALRILRSIPPEVRTAEHAELERQINNCNDPETLIEYVIKVLDMIK